MCFKFQNALETIDGEIIVIDNNSRWQLRNDGKAFSNVKLIRNQDNVGFPKEIISE
jgi:GT2 family glycosyltransferase